MLAHDDLAHTRLEANLIAFVIEVGRDDYILMEFKSLAKDVFS